MRALARSVEALEAQAEGFEEVTLRVGRAGSRRRKRFLGRRVAQWRRGAGEDGIEVFTAFRTPRDGTPCTASGSPGPATGRIP